MSLKHRPKGSKLWPKLFGILFLVTERMLTSENFTKLGRPPIFAVKFGQLRIYTCHHHTEVFIILSAHLDKPFSTSTLSFNLKCG